MNKIMKEIWEAEISTINVPNLKSGVYAFSLFNEDKYRVSKKLVIEKGLLSLI
jgi:hypothetical protein